VCLIFEIVISICKTRSRLLFQHSAPPEAKNVDSQSGASCFSEAGTAIPRNQNNVGFVKLRFTVKVKPFSSSWTSFETAFVYYYFFIIGYFQIQSTSAVRFQKVNLCKFANEFSLIKQHPDNRLQNNKRISHQIVGLYLHNLH